MVRKRRTKGSIFDVTIAQKFEALLETYRRPNGNKWSGQNLHDATGGVVTRSYVTNLRKGRIQNPGYEKLGAIAKAMGFPPELWFSLNRDVTNEALTRAAAERRDIAGRVEYLFQTVKNDETGESYTNAEVARRTLRGVTAEDGSLTEAEIQGIRTGEIANPSVNQILALADVFDVQPSYFIDGKQPSLLDEETARALEDKATSAILHKSMGLSSRERDAILGIIQQFENLRAEPE
jgi:transcriptional regulator with XRE-family HTH domain